MSRTKSPRMAALSILVIAGGAALWGCPQPIDGPECGDDGGVHNDGGTTEGTDGGDAGVHGDGGHMDGQDGGVDGGMPPDVSRADAGPFAWALVPGTTTQEVVYGIHGNSPSNFYIASDTGRLRRSTGGPFTEVYVGTGANLRALYSVWVTPNGNVFAGGSGVLLHCLNGSCTQQSDFVVTPTANLSPASGTIHSLCGDGDGRVYASGDVLNGRLWQFDFTTESWKVIAADTGTSDNRGCWVAPGGDIFIAAAYGKMLRVDSHGVPVVETVEPKSGETSAGSFFDVVGAGGKMWAVGTGRRVITRNDGSAVATWSQVMMPASDNSSVGFNTVVSTAPDELLVAGGASNTYKVVRFNGEKWQWLPNEVAPPFYAHIHDAWAASPDLVYFVGEKGVDGVVIRGQR